MGGRKDDIDESPVSRPTFTLSCLAQRTVSKKPHCPQIVFREFSLICVTALRAQLDVKLGSVGKIDADLKLAVNAHRAKTEPEVTCADDLSLKLPSGPRVCIMGGTSFQNEHSEELTEALFDSSQGRGATTSPNGKEESKFNTSDMLFKLCKAKGRRNETANTQQGYFLSPLPCRADAMWYQRRWLITAGLAEVKY